jgi:TonB family protein
MTGKSQIGIWIQVLTTVLLAACNNDGNEDADRAGSDSAAVEQEPVPMPDPTPVQYPPALWDQKVEGETEVLVRVDESGDVDSAFVVQTSGYPDFDSAAVTGARKLRFTPGKRGDKRVAMWVRIPVRFAQDSTATVGAPRAVGVRQ